MSLVQTVANHSLIGHGGFWHDPAFLPPFAVATTCHFATIFWLYVAEFNREPTQANLINIGSAQLAVGQMVARGVRKNRPANGSLSLTAGSVLIFYANPTAGHSCVAIAPQTCAGYNQTGWWSLGGANHGYSAHPTSQLQWGAGPNKHKVQYAAHWYELYEVPEGVARAMVRQMA